MKKIVLFWTFAFVLFVAKAQEKVFTLNTLPVPDTGFYNGSDGRGYFADTVEDVWVKFYNTYDQTWGSWQGWAYSTWKDDTTEGYTNQWSTYSGYLIDSTFALAYVAIDWNNDYENIPAGIKFSCPVEPVSIYVANCTYTALVIKNGNSFARAFEPGDYFKLIIIGINNGMPTDTIEHFLADYRDSLKYIQKDWAYIDLRPLGEVDSISFNVVSTDVGDYGMNTPGYFALDLLRFNKSSRTTAVFTPDNDDEINIYPNPSTSYFIVPQNITKTELYDIYGHKIGEWSVSRINVYGLQNGLYIVRLWDGQQWISKKLIIKH